MDQFKKADVESTRKLNELAEKMSDVVQVLAEIEMLKSGMCAEHSYAEGEPEEETCNGHCLANFGPIPKRFAAPDFVTCRKSRRWYHNLCLGIEEQQINWRCPLCQKIEGLCKINIANKKIYI